jgi:hypothetical protein
LPPLAERLPFVLQRNENTMEMSGFVALLAAIVASRFINESGYRKLEPDQKLHLMDGFSRTRAYSMIPLLALVGAFWFFMTSTDIDRNLISVAYFGLLIAYIVVRIILNQRKLTDLDMPDHYKKTFTIAQIVSFCGVAWLFFTMFYK